MTPAERQMLDAAERFLDQDERVDATPPDVLGNRGPHEHACADWDRALEDMKNARATLRRERFEATKGGAQCA